MEGLSSTIHDSSLQIDTHHCFRQPARDLAAVYLHAHEMNLFHTCTVSLHFDPQICKDMDFTPQTSWVWHAVCSCCTAEEDWHYAHLVCSEVMGWESLVSVCVSLFPLQPAPCSCPQLQFLAWLCEPMVPQKPWTTVATTIPSCNVPCNVPCRANLLPWADSGAGTHVGGIRRMSPMW